MMRSTATTSAASPRTLQDFEDRRNGGSFGSTFGNTTTTPAFGSTGETLLGRSTMTSGLRLGNRGVIGGPLSAFIPLDPSGLLPTGFARAAAQEDVPRNVVGMKAGALNYHDLRKTCEDVELHMPRDLRNRQWELPQAPSFGPYIATPWEQLLIHPSIPFPPEVLQSHNRGPNGGCGFFVLPLIEHACISIAQELYLWKYNIDIQHCGLQHLSFGQDIVTATVFPPKPGVFQEHIKYLLAISTAGEVVIYGVAASENDYQFLPSDLRITIDGGHINKLLGMRNGRLLMCGTDGSVNEFQYGAGGSSGGWFSGLFRSKCRRVYATSRVTGYIAPIIKWFTSAEPLVDAALDDYRNILYTLSDSDTLKVYDLGADGFMCPAEVAVLQTPWTAVAQTFPEPQPQLVTRDPHKLPDQYKNESWDRAIQAGRVDSGLVFTDINQKWNYLLREGIVSERYYQGIYVLPPSETTQMHLVAVTMHGARVYYSTTNQSDPITTRPYTLRVAHVRMPPPTAESNSLQSCPLYSQGVFFLQATDSNTLFVVAPQVKSDFGDAPPHVQYMGQGANFEEQISPFQFPERIWCLCDVVEPQPHLPQHNDFCLSSRNELVLQHLRAPKTFVCMTGTGVRLMTKQRPIDQLLLLLQKSGIDDDTEINTFFTAHGNNETCAMLLSLICDISGDTTLSSKTNTQDLRDFAIHTFYKHGGVAKYIKHADGLLLQGECPYSSLGSQLANLIQYSHKHEAIYLVVSRLLSPLWRTTLFPLPCPLPQLATLEQVLLRISDFLATYITRAPTYGLQQQFRALQNASAENAAELQESQSIARIKELIKHCAETVALLQLYNENCPRGNPHTAVTFREFLCDSESSLAQQLITEIMDEQIRVNNSDHVSLELETRCSSYFSKQTHLLYKGRDLLLSAKQQKNPVLLKEALEYYKQIRDPPFSELIDVCYDHPKLFIDVATTVARIGDPTDISSHWTPTADATVRNARAHRMNCYKYIFALLDELPKDIQNDTIGHILQISDKTLHWQLYDWLLTNKSPIIYDIETPFIEEFFKFSQKENLAEWYQKHGKLEKAAKIYFDLGTIEGNVSLEDKLQRLNKAAVLDPRLRQDTQALIPRIEIQSLLLKKFQVDKIAPPKELEGTILSFEQLLGIAISHRIYESVFDVACWITVPSDVLEDAWEKLLNTTTDIQDALAVVSIQGRKYFRHYPNGPFLLDFLVSHLETMNFRSNRMNNLVHHVGTPLETHIHRVASTMLKIGVKETILLQAYHQVYNSRAPVPEQEWKIHLLQIIRFLNTSLLTEYREGKTLLSRECIGQYLRHLQESFTRQPETEELTREFQRLLS